MITQSAVDRWAMRCAIVAMCSIPWIYVLPAVPMPALPDWAIPLLYGTPAAVGLALFWVIDQVKREFAEAKLPPSERI